MFLNSWNILTSGTVFLITCLKLDVPGKLVDEAGAVDYEVLVLMLCACSDVDTTTLYSSGDE